MSHFRSAVFALAAALWLPAGAALAHSFNLLLVVPLDDPVAEDMRRAVLLAADERDGHPDNHSDGHLGGLDVYVTLSSELSDPTKWSEADPDIVVDSLFEPMVIYYGNEDWFALFGSQLDRLDRAETLANAADPDVDPFAARFEEMTGRAPEREAEAAYLAARLVDLIVRPLDDAGDPAALLRQLEGLR